MAAFIPSKDVIVMPPRGAFESASSLYSVLAHEHIHWTGAKNRLNRELAGRWKQESYSFEEIVAELGACYALASFQIPHETRSASYIDSWLRILKSDNRAIFQAAAHAQRAVNFLQAFPAQQEEAA